MASTHQLGEVGKRRTTTPFHKGTLVPIWIIQCVVLLLYIGVLSWEAFYAFGQNLVEDVVILVLCAICLLLDITEMILFRTKRLKPLLFLFFQVVKVALWLVVFAVCLSCIMREKTRYHRNVFSVEGVFAGGLIEVVIISLAFLASLILGSLIYHRHRKASHNSIIYRPTPDPYHRRTFIEERCTTAHSPNLEVVHFPNLEVVHHPNLEVVHHPSLEVVHHPNPEVVHPAYRGSIYKGPMSRRVDASSLTERTGHARSCYEGEGTVVGQVVEMGVSKGKAPSGGPVTPSTGSRRSGDEEVFEMGSNRSLRRDS